MGTCTSSPSRSTAARFSCRSAAAASTRGPNPPAAATASPTRDPAGSRYTPGSLTAPPTSTTSSPATAGDPGGPSPALEGCETAIPPSTSITGSARDTNRNAAAPTTTAIATAPIATHGVPRGVGSASAGAVSAASSARHGAPDGSTGEQLPGGPRRAGGGPSTPLGALPTGSTSVTNATRRDLSGAYLPARGYPFSSVAPPASSPARRRAIARRGRSALFGVQSTQWPSPRPRRRSGAGYLSSTPRPPIGRSPMTFERSPGPPEAHQPFMVPDPSGGSATPSGGPTPVQIRLQILTTEHWSLLASRSLAWNESFTRASMFLSTLTGSIVALSLIGVSTASTMPSSSLPWCSFRSTCLSGSAPGSGWAAPTTTTRSPSRA